MSAAKTTTKNAVAPDAFDFRETAKKAIGKYSQRSMLVDAMMWSRIVGEYEQERAQLLAACDELEGTLAATASASDLTDKGHAAVRQVLASARAAIAKARGK